MVQTRVTVSEMESRLSSHSAYFSSMVALIPQKFYTVKDQDQEATDNKYWINKKQTRAPKQAVKEASQKAKKLKFDPESQKTPELSHTNETNELTTEDIVYTNGETEQGAKERDSAGSFSVERVQSSDLNDLQERLKHKIEELRGKRKTRDFDNPGEVSQKKLKRVERKKRKKEMRQKQKAKKQQKVATKTEEDSTSKRPCVKDEESGRLVFSKFDFTTPQGVEPASSSSSSKKQKKDYRKLLAKAEAAQKKLDEIKAKDQERAEELQEKLRWQKAVDMAKGKKLKDDPQLLKKTMKRIEKKKDKSRKQWNKREKMEELTKEKRQEKRMKNIKERTEKIKAKKLKKRRPGF